MADMVVTLSGDEAKLWKAQQKIIEQQVAMEQGYKRVAKSADTRIAEDAIKAQDKAIQGVVQSFASYVSGMSAVTMAAAALKMEFADIVELQKKTADKSKKVAPSQQTMSLNASSFTDEEVKALHRRILPELSATHGVPLEDLNKASSTFMSLSGVSNLKDFSKFMDAAAKTTDLNPENIGTLAGAGFKLSRDTGLDADKAIKFLFATMSKTPTEQIGTFAAPFSETISASAAANANQDPLKRAEETAALMTAMQSSTGKLTSEETVTFLTGQFLPKLSAFFSTDNKTKVQNSLTEQLNRQTSADLGLEKIASKRTQLVLDVNKATTDLKITEQSLKRFGGKRPEGAAGLAYDEIFDKAAQQREKIASAPLESKQIDEEQKALALQSKLAAAEVKRLSEVKQRMDAFGDPGTLAGRMKLFESEAVRKEFMQTLGEGKQQEVVKRVMTPGSVLAGEFASNISAMDQANIAKLDFSARANPTAQTKEQRAANRRDQIEINELMKTDAGRMELAREHTLKGLKATNNQFGDAIGNQLVWASQYFSLGGIGWQTDRGLGELEQRRFAMTKRDGTPMAGFEEKVKTADATAAFLKELVEISREEKEARQREAAEQANQQQKVIQVNEKAAANLEKIAAQNPANVHAMINAQTKSGTP